MKVVATVLCVLIIQVAGVLAQAADPPAPTFAPEKLPVSIERIRLQLKAAPPTKFAGLRIEQTIEVVGVAPKVLLWNPGTAKLANGPVPFGAPTQKDILDLITPQEFKRYPVDLNALMRWLAERLGEKTAE
ncbi:MAG: hypothetical protein EXQ55_08795 [Acidobacteria bacterium]|nr:hypothetical protein [Acidobacteriota bacterium]